MALAPRPSDILSEAMVSSDEDRTLHLEEKGDPSEENYTMQGVVQYVKSRFEKAKDGRRNDEERWERSYRNYRGLYGPDMQFTDNEHSQVFLKITKTKVLAAYAQITEVLFAGGKFPIGVEPSPVSLGVEDIVSVDTQPSPQQGDPKKSATIARPELKSLGIIENRVKEVEDKVISGRTGKPTDVVYEPAVQSARLMEKTIHDQLEESDAGKHLRAVCLEMAMLGTGVMKGPFVERKEYSKWDKTGTYTPETKIVPKVSYVSVWNVYPDPDARSINDCDYFIERHKMRRSELKDLKRNPTFRSRSIDAVLDLGPSYEEEQWEHTLSDDSITNDINRYEVLEYWGMLDRETAEHEDLFKIPDELKDRDQFQVNVWVCNDTIIRMVLNPFTPNRIPYHAVPYEISPYSFFGVGVAENMDDTQTLMNGFMRMAVDNAALSGNLMVEVDENNLAPGQDMSIYPGKIWRRQGGAPGQAIFGTTFPNVSQELFQMFDKARQLADESTGMPSYAHGGTSVGGVGRTASGMSMLMGAAAQNIKAVVRNIDDYLLAPLGKAFFAFNMQFRFDEQFTNGDLAVLARGTESLMRNEIRSQRLLQFMQMTANPQMAPLVRYDYILRELAASMDLDEEKILNDPRSAALQAMVIKEYQEASGMAPPPQPQQAPVPGGPPAPADPTGTGNGNIAPGAAPEPGAEGFTSPQAQQPPM